MVPVLILGLAVATLTGAKTWARTAAPFSAQIHLLGPRFGRLKPPLRLSLATQTVATKKPTGKSGSKASDASSTPPTSSGRGFKVQVFYLAARSTNSPNAPVKDALWFATYPIIPRIGDCVFRDGVYYRVERVFLYENLAAGWCADVEVSFYGRR
jgi:hypothetical protein